MSATHTIGSRNIGVDLAKFFACIGVLIVHLVGRDSSPVNGAMFFLAGIAVPVFFIANGYFILNRRLLTYDYVFKKLLAVASVVLLWSALWWAVMCLKDRAFVNPLVVLLKSVLGLGGLSWFWFFGALVIVQLLAPVLSDINSRTPHSQAALLFIACVSCLFVHALDLRAMNSSFLGVLAVPEALRLWTWVAYFLWGGVLGSQRFNDWARSHVSKKRVLLLLVACACLVVVFQYVICCCGYGIKWPEHFYDSPITMAFALLFFIACDLYPPRAFVQNVCEGGILSEASCCIMGVYIIHPFIWQFIQHFYSFMNPLFNLFIVVLVGVVSFAITHCLRGLSGLSRFVRL